MIRALDQLSFLLFLIGCLLLGVFGTWQEAAPFWPGAACLWVSALLGVFTLHWRQRGTMSRTCMGAVVVFTGYIFWRGLNSDVAYLARHDLVFCATAFVAWVQMAARHEGAGRRYAVMFVWGLLILGNLGCGLYQKYVDVQANPLSFLGFRRDTGDAIFCGFFPNSNHLCGFMELTGFFFLAVAVFGRVQIFVRAACGLVFLAATLNVALSTSRGGLAFGIGAVTFAGLAWVLNSICKSDRRSAGVRTGLQLAGAAVACVVVGWVTWTQLEQKFGTGNVFKNLNGRAEVWGRAYEQWNESPILGTGARSFEYFERSYRNMNSDWITWSQIDVDAIFAHNEWLQLLADYGLIGLLLGIAVLGIHCWKAMSHLIREALTAEPGRSFADHRGIMVLGALCGMIPFAIHCAADFQMHIGTNAVTAAIVLAIMANPGVRASERESRQLDAPRSWRAAAILLAAAPAGVTGWKAVDWAIGDYHTYRGAGVPDAAAAMDPSIATLGMLLAGQQDMRKAVVADPLNYAAWALLGRTEGAIGLYFESEAANAKPPGHSPLTPGYLRTALTRFKKACALYPQNADYAMFTAVTLDQMGKSEEAEPWWKKALQWGDGSRLIHHAYGDHCMLRGKYEEALSHYFWALHKSAGPTRELLDRKQKRAQELMKKKAAAGAPPSPSFAPPPNTPPVPN